MNVLMVSAELAPFAKTGGLADAVTGLSDALAARGHDVRVLLPKYEHLPPADVDATPLDSPVGGRRVLELVPPKARRARGRKGKRGTRDRLPARSRGAHAGPDLPRRRPRRGPLPSAHAGRRRLAGGARLAPRRAALPRLARGARAARAALAARRRGPRRRSSRCTTSATRACSPTRCSRNTDSTRSARSFAPDALAGGTINFLRAGLRAADAVTTVSPTYAREIRTAAFGMGLEDVLNARPDDVVGILNGVDYDVWGPQKDPFLDFHYDATNLAPKSCHQARRSPSVSACRPTRARRCSAS